MFTSRRYDLLHTLQVVKVDKKYNIWIYPFDVPVGGGASAEEQIRRLEMRIQGTEYRDSHFYGPVDFLLRVRGLLDPRAPYPRVDPASYFAAWITGSDQNWTKTPNTFDNRKPEDLMLSRSVPLYNLGGPGFRGQTSGSRPEYSHDSWMRQPQSSATEDSRADRGGGTEPAGGYGAAASGGAAPPPSPPNMFG